jgi:hypothetical protein
MSQVFVPQPQTNALLQSPHVETEKPWVSIWGFIAEFHSQQVFVEWPGWTGPPPPYPRNVFRTKERLVQESVTREMTAEKQASWHK